MARTEIPEFLTRQPNGNRLQVKRNPDNAGTLIMRLAEVLRPSLAAILGKYRDENGMQVQPSRIRGIALVVAQELIKSEPRMTLEEMSNWNADTKHRMESIIYNAFLKSNMDEFTTTQ